MRARRPMLRAVLLDLDNTLILFDENAYFQGYLALVKREFSDLMEPSVLVDKLIAASRKLMDNKGRMTNEEWFMDAFALEAGGERDGLRERFERFYRTEYDRLRPLVTVAEGAREVVSSLKAMGLALVAASNPILPLEVQMRRLAWAGLDDIDFVLVTHLGNMSYLKPQPGFFLEVCGRIGCRPEECLMVGNDPVNDMAASLVGMKTYLVTDSLTVDGSQLALSRSIRNNDDSAAVEPDFRGRLLGVPKAAAELMKAGDRS